MDGNRKSERGGRGKNTEVIPYRAFPSLSKKQTGEGIQPSPVRDLTAQRQTSGSGLHGLSDFFMQPMLPGKEKSRRRSDEDGGVRTNQNACGNRPGEVFHGRTSKEVQAHQHGQRGKRGQNSTESVWLMASFMICEALSFGSEKRRNSRMRSNTIILSLMEYPPPSTTRQYE